MNLLDLLGGAITVLGAALIALASLGLLRFTSPLVRLHVAAKASSAGILLTLAGTGVLSRSGAVAIELALTGVFLAVTVPLATHGLAHAHLAAEQSERSGRTEPTTPTPRGPA